MSANWRRAIVFTTVALSVLVLASPTAAKGPPNPPHGSAFGVEVCVTGNDITIRATWQGIAANAIAFGIGDGTGAGLGDIVPLENVMRSGSLSETFTAAASLAQVAGADVRLGGAVMASQTYVIPTSGWSACV